MLTEPQLAVAAPVTTHTSLTPEIVESLNIDAENEISKVLAVPDLDQPEINEKTQKNVIIDSDVESEPEVRQKKQPKFVPGGVKTRADLIRKIQEISEVNGNQAEVKKMRLHRRRRNSLDLILKEQFAKAVTSEAEKRMGIPPQEDTDGRLSYAVNALYRFDLCCCKLVEKAVEYLDMGATCEGLSATIDGDPRIRSEIKKSFRDWLIENNNMEWIETAASPSTRILLCHLYPLISVLRAKPTGHKNTEISPEVQLGIATATLRNAVDPPRRPTLPNGMRLV